MTKLTRDEWLIGLGVHAALTLLLEECRDECDAEDRDDYAQAYQACMRVAERYRARLKSTDNPSHDVPETDS